MKLCVAHGFRPLFLLSIVAAAAALAPPTSAQQPEMDELAVKLSQAISRSHQKSVLVFDFIDLDGNYPELAAVLADELSVALEKAAKGFQVLDRARLKEGVDLSALSSKPAKLKEFAKLVTDKTGATVFVVGEMWPIADKAELTLKCFQAPKGKELATFSKTIPVTPAKQELFNKWTKAISSLPRAGADGYSMPQCVSCPSPSYSDEAIQEKLQGTVLLRVVVTEEGRITNVRLVRALGSGLDQKAIEQVRTWKLHPAIGPDGKPAAVTTMIEVTFRLLK